MIEFRHGSSAIRVAMVLTLSTCVAFAQTELDEDSLLAQEELTLTDAVEGELPAADAGGEDDFLSELFGDSDGAAAGAALGSEAADLPLDDLLAGDDAEPETAEVVPESLDAVVEGIEAAPADDIDAFPLDKGFDADAVVDEMMEMGDSDAVAEDASAAASTPDPEEDAADLDAMLGEMVAEEPTAEPVAAEAPATVAEPAPPAAEDDLGFLFGDEPAAEEAPAAVAETVEEKGMPAAGDDDLGFLFGDEPAAEEAPAAVADAEAPAAEPAAGDDDLGFLFGDEPAAEEAPAAVADAEAPAAEPAAGDDDLGFLFGDEPATEEAPAAVADSEAPAAEPAAGDDDLGFLFGDEPAAEAPTPAAEPAAVAEPAEPEGDNFEALFTDATPEEPATAVTPAPTASDAGDDDSMSLGSDIFKSLAREAMQDMKTAPASVRSSGVAVDPFADALSQPADPSTGAVAAPPAPTAPATGDSTFSLDEFVADEAATLNNEMAESAPAAVPSRDLPDGAAAFEEAERLKRIAREYHATSLLASGEEALRIRDYPRAIQLYEQAFKYLPPREDLKETREKARKGLSAAYYLQALSLERQGDYEKAKVAAQQAVKYGYIRAEEAVLRIQRKEDEPPPPPPPAPEKRWEEDDYVQVNAQIKEWLKRGREAYLTGEYDRAILAFESVLARDPENKEAIRLMHSAANKKYDRSSMELDTTAARMMATVRDTWNPRQYGLHETPLESRAGSTSKMRGDDEVRRAEILKKMTDIRIPEVDFRQANIRDVVTFLHEQSVEFDPAPDVADRTGVNIILKLDDAGGAAAPAAEVPANDFFSAAPAADTGGAGGNETLVTFSALDITLKEALDYSVDIAGLKYLIRGNAVMVMPRDATIDEIEHRMYDVLPSAITRLQELSSAVTSGNNRMRGAGDFIQIEGSGGGGGEEVDLKGFFTEMGVEWPSKSSIKFVRGLGKLVVANTLENLTVFEKVLSILNVVPYQIEIEARFVEVAQTDVDSLGLEWLLNDDWEIAQKKGSAGTPLGARERIVMNANGGTGGFTAGNRFLNTAGLGVNSDTMTDTIASLSGVLTNPELTVVLHALQQRGHTDLLSAPKITTQSGQSATIKVVTEYIYPTEFETSGIGGDNNNTATGTTGGGIVGAVVTPREFQTREVGVILEVTPEVSPEGQMINLSLSPEVVSEPTWRNYGSTYTSYDPNGNPVTQELNMEQPFFHTRKLTTNLLIYNGATVVMGGMITEVRNNVDDKVPLLGDIPLIGRLFRSQYESSEKRNLLIFVTARLVDPSGRALDRERFGVDKSIAEKLVTDETDGN
jgi:general secretion pathway protein D